MMEIQALAPSHFLPYAESIRGASETTWKTHALVVLSYLLIGIGVALACASVYVATVFHPMVAAATPIVPLATGILLHPNRGSASFFSPTRAPVYIKGQPLGLVNRDSKGYVTNCFCNAAFQILVHASSYKALMEELVKESDSFLQNLSKPLFTLISAYKKYQEELAEEKKPISSVKTQALREWLSYTKKISAFGTHETPADLFEALHEISRRYPLPLLEQQNGKHIVNAQEYFLPIMVKQNVKTSFKELFNANFENNESNQQIKKWFSEAPIGFLVPIHRTAISLDSNKSNPTYVKHQEQIEIPMEFELTKEQCPNGNRKYTPDVFIVHEGVWMVSGHFISYVRRNGYWWEINDTLVSQISDKQATEKLHHAYMVHYTQA